MPVDDENVQTDSEKRIQQLIRERNAARSDLQEAKAEIASLTEGAAASGKSVETAVAQAKAEMQSRIEELEGQIRKGGYRELLLADKVKPEDMEDLMEYLDYQYAKVPAPEGGGAKPEFKDWYAEARKTNKVLRGAMKASASSKADEGDGEAEPETKPTIATKPAAGAKPVIPAKPAVVAEKPGSLGTEVDMSKLKLGTAEWKAAKERLKSQAFGKAR